MLRGYRSVVTAIAGLAIVGSGLWLLVKDLSSIDSAYRHSAADAAIKYQRYADTYVKERCISPTGLREIDCASKADEAAREGQRKEQDLAAQNITAWWTKVMGIAALIGMALSAVGVWLIKTTFDETQKANEIARSVAINDTRPIIVFRGMKDLTNAPELFFMCGQWENIGKGPAKIVTLETKEYYSEFDEEFDAVKAFSGFDQARDGCKGLIVGPHSPMSDLQYVTFVTSNFQKRVRVVFRMSYMFALGNNKQIFTTEVVRVIFPRIDNVGKTILIKLRDDKIAQGLPIPTETDFSKIGDDIAFQNAPIGNRKIVGVCDGPTTYGDRMT